MGFLHKVMMTGIHVWEAEISIDKLCNRDYFLCGTFNYFRFLVQMVLFTNAFRVFVHLH